MCSRPLSTQLAPLQGGLTQHIEQHIQDAIQPKPEESPAGASSPQVDESELPVDQTEPLLEVAPVKIVEEGIAGDRNTLEDILKPVTAANEPVDGAALAQERNLGPLTSLGLAARLGVDNSGVSRNKDKGDGNEHFRKWSAKRDPDGIAWEYRPGKARSAQYYPLT